MSTSKLDQFLSLPNVESMSKKIYAGERLGEITIKPMKGKDHKSYQDQCKSSITAKGMTFDNNKFNALVVAYHTIDPNISNVDFLTKAGYKLPEHFVMDKLLAGEIADISEQICKYSGFNVDINEEVEEAKN